ncbi:hypothetical protein KI387_034107, partial [Taxus chinensis]
GYPLRFQFNKTCEFQESNDGEENEDYEEPKEEVDEDPEELGNSQVNFLTVEGVDDEDEYDEVVIDMNSDSYVVMTQ